MATRIGRGMVERETTSRWWLVACVAVGAAVRVYLAMTATLISRDAVVYVTMARRMVTDWRAELAQDYPLGFPFLIRCVHAIVGPMLGGDVVMGWQRSGQIASLLFGVLSIVLVYWIARRVVGERAAVFAAWIWALLPQAAALSADALTDVPTVTLMIAGVLAVMRGMDSGRAGWWLFAGLLSGAASTMRPEGAEVVLVGLAVLMFKRRNVETSKSRNDAREQGIGNREPGEKGTEALRQSGTKGGETPHGGWRRTFGAAAALVVGFGVIGGSYILLEGGRVLHKQTWMGEARAGNGSLVGGRDAIVMRANDHGSVAPSGLGVSNVSDHGVSQATLRLAPSAIGCRPCRAEGAGIYAGAGVFSAVGLVVEKTFGSLNGVWMIWGTAWLVVRLWARGRGRYEKGFSYPRGKGFSYQRGRYEKGFSYQRALAGSNGVVAGMWWSLHAAVLVWFAMRAGYVSSRHCLVLDVCFVVLSAGMLAWIGASVGTVARPTEAGEMRGQSRTSSPARWIGVAVLVVSCAGLTPRLLRDIHEGRGYVREAAAWIAKENGGEVNRGIVAVDGWVPFYSGAIHWAGCETAAGLSACAELGDSAWLVLPSNEKAAERVRIEATGRTVTLSEAARFGEASGRRGLVVYRVGRE
ncbi:MAG: glycosyltransferase family 39 protein [Planctomycetes bacterium]|nr:glycosyltransferase family 39 protein [Planctomycetota bacterium]